MSLNLLFDYCIAWINIDSNCNSRSIYVGCFVNKQFGTEFVSDVIKNKFFVIKTCVG